MHGRPIFFVLLGTITFIYDYDYDLNSSINSVITSARSKRDTVTVPHFGLTVTTATSIIRYTVYQAARARRISSRKAFCFTVGRYFYGVRIPPKRHFVARWRYDMCRNARENFQNLIKWVQSLCAPLRPFRSKLKENFCHSILPHVL